MSEKHIYFAPMEGITGFRFRNLYHEFYGGVEKYFTPFLTPGAEMGTSGKGFRDVLPENNQGVPLVPQILTNRADRFLDLARVLYEYGYREINFNLGCPSGTVVGKGRGSGFLAYPDELEAFLDQVFSSALVSGGDLSVSIKTRIGKDSPEEWPRLMEIYNQYPLKELIIHPRVRTDMYKNRPNLEVFEAALKESKNPVVYNGDIFSLVDYEEFSEKFPQVNTLMLGRGLLIHPALAEEICRLGEGDITAVEVLEKRAFGPIGLSCQRCPETGECFGSREELARLHAFHDRLLESYGEVLSGERPLLFKMKELWSYLGKSFPDGAKLVKKIQKCQRLSDYKAIVQEIFLQENFTYL